MKEQTELHTLGNNNNEWTIAMDSLNSGRLSSRVERGDRVMLQNCTGHDSLDSKCHGSVEVMTERP